MTAGMPSGHRLSAITWMRELSPLGCEPLAGLVFSAALTLALAFDGAPFEFEGFGCEPLLDEGLDPLEDCCSATCLASTAKG